LRLVFATATTPVRCNNPGAVFSEDFVVQSIAVRWAEEQRRSEPLMYASIVVPRTLRRELVKTRV
jgi:hypothetical protein